MVHGEAVNPPACKAGDTTFDSWVNLLFMKNELQNCKEAVFHFNKASLTNPSVPPWVIKAKGETHYVKHVVCNAPWTTKETPDSPHTKGSIKIKDIDIVIENDEAVIMRRQLNWQSKGL